MRNMFSYGKVVLVHECMSLEGICSTSTDPYNPVSIAILSCSNVQCVGSPSMYGIITSEVLLKGAVGQPAVRT